MKALVFKLATNRVSVISINLSMFLYQAIPTAREMLGYDAELFVVSLAPPQEQPKPVPSGVINQVAYWLNYFSRLGTLSGIWEFCGYSPLLMRHTLWQSINCIESIVLAAV